MKREGGWTILHPVGLSLYYRYVLPGCSKNGVEGKDYFEGDDPVIEHLLKTKVIVKSADEALFYLNFDNLQQSVQANNTSISSKRDRMDSKENPILFEI